MTANFYHGPELIELSGTTQATATQSASVPQETDPYFQQVSLLLHFEGEPTTITDSGPLGLTITRSGPQPVISTLQGSIGSSSLAFNNGLLNLPEHFSLLLDEDFFIEWSVFHTSLSGKQAYIVSMPEYPGDPNDQIAYENGLFIYPPSQTLTLSLTANTWSSLALGRDGPDVYWFKDGTVLGSATHTNPFDFRGGAIGSMLGYFDELRITKGVCRYTSSYVPRTTPFPDA